MQNIKSGADPADQHEIFVNGNCAKYFSSAVGSVPRCSFLLVRFHKDCVCDSHILHHLRR